LDFMFKLRSVRRRSYASWLRRPDALTPSGLEKLEIDLCRHVAHTMCGSQTEADFLRSHGVSASYLPVVGPTVPRPSFDALPDCRLLLFGKPNTAMRAARHHLQSEIWPILERQGLDLDWHQLGDKPRPGADPSWPWVEANFTVHGHVDELGSVLRAGDASVMPYPWDTGGRAKFGVSAGYGVVNVAYDTTFLCASEFTPGEDSLAATSPEHFVELLRELTGDINFRRRLSEASRETYERHHTTEVQLPRYEEILHVAAR
jgi:glycosyltransferase involved in cell wall biosynthesis